MHSTFQTGPAVGIEGGCLLIGWPCRSAGAEGPYNMVPISLKWDVTADHSIVWIAVLMPNGRLIVYDAELLEFDPKWERT